MSEPTEVGIPTADAEPVESKSWYWIAAVPLSIPASILLLVVLTGILGPNSSLSSIALAPIVLVLFPWVFGLRNDIRAVKKADVDWQPSLLRYFALSVVLTPYVGATIYMLQRYRRIGLDTALPR